MNRSEKHRRAITAGKLYLEMRGYNIIELGWRQSRYTIDIIAKKDAVYYFVGVEALRDGSASDQIERLSDQKHIQLSLAVNRWAEDTLWHGETRLALIEILGDSFSVINFIEI